MYGELYLIFKDTYDGLAMLTASFYPTNSIILSNLEEVAEDFHRVYVFLNYKYLLDVIKKGFGSFINDIDEDENGRNFTLKFAINIKQSNILGYVKTVMEKINDHPDHLLESLCYKEESIREDVFELYLHAARKLILDIEWMNE